MSTSATIHALQASFNGLVLDSEGLSPRDNPLPKLNKIAELAVAVIELTKSPINAEDVLAHRLAVLTKEMLATTWNHGSPDLVRSWMLARAELLELQAQTREAGEHTKEDLE